MATNEVKSLLAEQYDPAFGYRFMEALRNQVQHAGSPLDTLSQGSRTLKADEQSETISESFLEPLCSKSALAERGGFNVRILGECPDLINLRCNTGPAECGTSSPGCHSPESGRRDFFGRYCGTFRKRP